jgi:polyphosphate kinase
VGSPRDLGGAEFPVGPEPEPGANPLMSDPAPTMLLSMSTARSALSVEEAQPSLAQVKNRFYEAELARLQVELVKQQEYIRAHDLKVVVIFEGRDAAGKGGAIKRITETLNPRAARVVALAAPTERERGEWYFQRYVTHLPAKGEMVLFDRSWYNRAGVERVMGFCTDEEYWEFLRSCPDFERLLVRGGTQLIKYWFSVSDAEQEKRFQARLQDPTKRWKLSPMDMEARNRWVDFSKAKDAMFAATDIPEAPWWVVEADVKKRARLNVMTHLLAQIPYEDLTPAAPPQLPPRPTVGDDYRRPPKGSQHLVPDVVPQTTE